MTKRSLPFFIRKPSGVIAAVFWIVYCVLLILSDHPTLSWTKTAAFNLAACALLFFLSFIWFVSVSDADNVRPSKLLSLFVLVSGPIAILYYKIKHRGVHAASRFVAIVSLLLVVSTSIASLVDLSIYDGWAARQCGMVAVSKPMLTLPCVAFEPGGGVEDSLSIKWVNPEYASSLIDRQAVGIFFLLAMVVPCLAFFCTRTMTWTTARAAVVSAALAVFWSPVVLFGHGIALTLSFHSFAISLAENRSFQGLLFILVFWAIGFVFLDRRFRSDRESNHG